MFERKVLTMIAWSVEREVSVYTREPAHLQPGPPGANKKPPGPARLC